MVNVNADEAAKVTAIAVEVETGGAVAGMVVAVTVKGVGALCAVVVSPRPARLCCVLPFLFLFFMCGVFHFLRICLEWWAREVCYACFPAV